MILGLFTGQARSFWTQPGLDLSASGGGRRDKKLTTNVNWSSRFRVWVVLGSVWSMVKLAGNYKIITEKYKTSPKLANILSESANFR